MAANLVKRKKLRKFPSIENRLLRQLSSATTTPSPAPLDLNEMLAVAYKVCGQAGYPYKAEIEYRSAINYAVGKAARKFDPARPNGRNPCSLAAIYALRQCKRTKRTLAFWRKQDEAGALRSRAKPAAQTPIPLRDFELLSFVACHGRWRASILLGLRHEKLRGLLDDVEFRLREGVSF